jgi:cell division protein FtsB
LFMHHQTVEQKIAALPSGFRTLSRYFSESAVQVETFLQENHMGRAAQAIAQLQSELSASQQSNAALAQQLGALQQSNAALTQQVATFSAEPLEDAADVAAVDSVLGPPSNTSGGTASGGTANVPSGTVTTASAKPLVALTDTSGKTVYAGPAGFAAAAPWTMAGTYAPPAGQVSTVNGAYVTGPVPVFSFAGDTAPGQQNGVSIPGFYLVMVP